MASDENISIQHALNRGEVKIGAYYVDGYAERDGFSTVYEFLCCFWHGHPKCHCSTSINPMTKIQYGLMHQQWLTKLEALKEQHNVHVQYIWECEWNRLKNTSADVKAFLKTFGSPERLDPRDALFGGRTNAIHLKFTAREGETIQYNDVCSLYPFCNKTKTYPIGHPDIIFRDFKPLDTYFGIVKATVCPPKGLYHPVLPHRVGGKLFFPLCRLCAESENQVTDCSHTDSERSLTGTWVSIELVKAVEKGYRIVEIFEIWDFTRTSDDLFADYMRTFLKHKQEASGFPPSVVDDEAKDRYIREYHEKEGVQLDKENIVVNSARRSLAKLAMNSLWGKMGERTNLMNTMLITDPEEFSHYLFSSEIDVGYFSFISDTVAMVQWR